jgi:pyruvate/2-oxoglutarate dehydrogenase complex dihydrolipoamide dehydrogenase (E3) component
MFTDSAPEADYSALPTAIFTDPELGGVGMTEEEAREEGLDFDVATHPLTAVTHAPSTPTRSTASTRSFSTGLHGECWASMS